MKRFNWTTATLMPEEETPVGFESSFAEIGPAIGAQHLAGSLYELAPGRRHFPYHWEANQEEWLIVLAGSPTVRAPDGDQELRPGDVACFPVGPEGAHQVRNDSDEPARFVIFSEFRPTNVVFYPDSDKLGVRTPSSYHRLSTAAEVEYWEGEAKPQGFSGGERSETG